MRVTLAILLTVLTFFSLAFATNYSEETVINIQTIDVEYRLMTKVEKDDGFYAAIRSLENNKVYLKSIPASCFNTKYRPVVYTLVEHSWTRDNGKTGKSIKDDYNELCQQSISKTQGA